MHGSFDRVNSIAWDQEASTLYIGGRFHAVESRSITSGLAIWNSNLGVVDFPGGGISSIKNIGTEAEVEALAYEPVSQVSLLRSITHPKTPFLSCNNRYKTLVIGCCRKFLPYQQH